MKITILFCILACIDSVFGFQRSLPPFGSSRESSTKLNIDIFGLGPPEIAVIGIAFVVLYGPDRIKSQLKNNGVKGEIVSEGWKASQKTKIKEMLEYAENSRHARAMLRLEEAIEQGDPFILDKLTAIEDEEA